jgi:hypothetical protein
LQNGDAAHPKAYTVRVGETTEAATERYLAEHPQARGYELIVTVMAALRRDDGARAM